MDIKPKYISIKDLYPRLFDEFPGLIKGTYYGVTGGTGTGKTKFAKSLFVSHAYEYCKENDIPLHIIYFALEESVDKFWITIVCDLLYQRYRTTITYYQYMGFHEGMTEEIRQQIEDVKPLIDDMKKYIKVLDYVSNPTGMYKEVRNVMDLIGETKSEVKYTDENNNSYTSFEFEYNNPDTHVIVVVDHVSLISPEKNRYNNCSTTHLAMSVWSEYVVKYICKKYKCIVCNVHQQEMAGENIDNMRANNLQPTIAKLADNKLIGRDYYNIISIFSPYRYKTTQKSYEGYDITKFKDHFRELKVIKHRDGRESISSPMLFYGKINKYKELPLPEDTANLSKVFSIIQKL